MYDDIEESRLTDSEWKDKLEELIKDKKMMKTQNIAVMLTRWFHYTRNVITLRDTQEMYEYNPQIGIYEPDTENTIRIFVQSKLTEAGAQEYAKTALVNEVMEAIKRCTYIKRDDINTHDWIILGNGVLKLSDLSFSPFSKDIISTTKVSVEYDANADCPLFKKFISEVLKPEDHDCIQEFFGYCLLKDYRFQQMFILQGGGANGKSTLLDTLTNMLGRENTASISLQDLSEDRFIIAELYGKMANIYADLDKTALKNTGKMKMLTGQDTITAQKKHKNPFMFVNYAKLIYSANELPITPDNSDAFWRRCVIITFPRKFSEEEQDKSLKAKLADPKELSGILNWSLIGLKRLLEKQKFSYSIPEDIRRQIYIKHSDPARAFVEEELEADADSIISKDDLYMAYVGYCKKNGFTATSSEVFGRRFLFACANEIPIREVRPRGEGDSRKRCWQGIRLKIPVKKPDESSVDLEMLQQSEPQELQVETIKMNDKQDNF